ncbi:hypothetical protein B0H94_107180 [Salsuginibacillus halophilus]|uniref:Uncharacterized protein n=1 Tax=Salsuginibacillus halophilus TaxID=517424 RepID=A0A2P8HG33_9BACI|nr:DUF5342 family protein [Salsuginibacillus halophilus]PSL45175.1 hypothetical protein B0H94_107180 [Salsuginibacillus halophilus]
MISHFQWKEMKNNWLNREWSFSFFYQGKMHRGTYYKDGTITWQTTAPKESDRADLERHIHDLMLYHVYEDHNPTDP